MKNEAEYRKNRYHNNSEVRKSRIKSVKKWRAKNLDAIKKWQQENPDKMRATQKKMYKKYYNMIHELKINGCAICGYNKCDASLDFHHVNPEDKKFSCGINGLTMHNSKDFGNEVNKCILLCRNCHGEIHTKERETKENEKMD